MFVILADPNISIIRRLEVYKRAFPQLRLTYYIVFYRKSVEHQRFLSSLRIERDSFNKLIDIKKNMEHNHFSFFLNIFFSKLLFQKNLEPMKKILCERLQV